MIDRPLYWADRFDLNSFKRALGRDEDPDLPLGTVMLADDVGRHPQASTIFDYLKQLGTATIVVEEQYVDGDYLGDYATFYASVFTQFQRLCKRVHFFEKIIFDTSWLERQILGNGIPAERFQACYLGFTVVRPLPQAIIGRTVLRTYPRAHEEKPCTRFYLAVQKTDVTLFGIPLHVQSLPFQQQDKVVSACATVALWSAFHASAEVFGTQRPRPAEITSAATDGKFQERVFPTTGLTFEQICLAVKSNGLEPEAFKVMDREGKDDGPNGVPARAVATIAGPDDKTGDEWPAPDFSVLSWIRAYLEMRLPVVIGVRLPDGRNHEATVVGYRLANHYADGNDPQHVREVRDDDHEAPSVGRWITHLYCHDDNLCPFASYQVLSDPGGGNIRFCVKDYKKIAPAGKEPIVTLIHGVVPVDQQIRLGFSAVQGWVTLLDDALSEVLEKDVAAHRYWDVRLMKTGDLKAEIAGLTLPAGVKMKLLVEPHPRYLWSLVLNYPGGELLRIAIDATAFERSTPLLSTIIYDQELVEAALPFLEKVFDRKETARHLHRYLRAKLDEV